MPIRWRLSDGWLVEQAPLIEGDRAQTENALMNLCFNALDAMSCGGTVTIATAGHGFGIHKGEYSRGEAYQELPLGSLSGQALQTGTACHGRPTT